MDPRAELEKRYPQADFWEYFHFLQSCIADKAADTNDHHICPRKQFPEFENGCPENLVTLKIADHIHAHKLLSAAVPEMFVNVNNRGYCGLTKEQRKEAGRKGGRQQVESGAYAVRIAKMQTPDKLAAYRRSGGLKAAELGYCAKNGLRVAHKRWHVARGIVSATCSLCVLSAKE
jgi:hypothetical protein